MKKRKIINYQLHGFSLTEVSIALIIMGILIGGALKGKQLIRSARLNVTASQLKNYEIELTQYRDDFGHLPGTQPDGHISSQKDVWMALAHHTHQEAPRNDHPQTKIGGILTLEKDFQGLSGHWLILSKNTQHEGILSPHEAKSFLSKYQETSATEGRVRVLNGTGTATCLTGSDLNLTETNPVCILAFDVT
jgi:prepilin-type N-terminal cleavage/methylation domain-containing protein